MRLMETWAHGLDIKVAILGRMTPIPEDDLEEDEEDPIADTPRLRHIAWLGHKSLPFAFEQVGETFPEQGIRVELMGPKYAAWRFGPEDTDQVIRGMAGRLVQSGRTPPAGLRNRIEGGWRLGRNARAKSPGRTRPCNSPG